VTSSGDDVELFVNWTASVTCEIHWVGLEGATLRKLDPEVERVRELVARHVAKQAGSALPDGARVIGGTTALAVSLASTGIPKDSIIHYESAIKANKFLLIASGSPAEVEKARETLAEHGGDVNLHAR
jgi:hypothetical protein